jgi:hypothetical protein
MFTANKMRSLLVAAFVGIFCSMAAGAPIIIDSFNDAPTVTGYPQHVGVFGRDYATSEITLLEYADTYVGARHVSVDTTAEINPEGSYGSADMIVAGGKLGLGTNSVVSPYTAKWGVNWNWGYHHRAVNLIGDGAPNTRFVLEFLSAEYDCQIQMSVGNSAGSHSPAVMTELILVPASSSPQTVYVPFSAFTIPRNSTPVSWTGVHYTDLYIFGAEDGDYELDNVSVRAPEPATMTLLAIGGLALLRRRTGR